MTGKKKWKRTLNKENFCFVFKPLNLATGFREKRGFYGFHSMTSGQNHHGLKLINLYRVMNMQICMQPPALFLFSSLLYYIDIL